jgi:hypothetical protein
LEEDMITVGITGVGSGIGQPILDSIRLGSLEARAIGRQGRERIVTGYSLRQIMALHDELYSRALEE